MTATGLLGREIELTIGVPGTPGILLTGGGTDDLHIAASIHHKMTGKPSPAKIKVWNPNPNTIAALQVPGCVVTLKVGYRTGGPPRLVFTGNPIRSGCEYKKEGTDGILTIDAHDGGDAIAGAYSNSSFATATTFEQAIAAAVAAFGTLPKSQINLGTASRVNFPKGITLVGPTRHHLGHLCAMAGLTWCIRDGALQILPIGVSTATQAVEFSATAGNLIGSPSPKGPGPSSSTGFPAGSIEVKALCEPSLRPGDPFVVQSKLLSGTYIARDVTFEIDSGYADPYYVVATGSPPGTALVGEGSGSVQTEKPGLSEAIHDSIQTALADVHTQMPGIVLTYDALTQTTLVQPATPQVRRDPVSGVLAMYLIPPLAGVPVIFPGGAAGGLTFPLAKGDPVVLLFCERSTDTWKSTGQETNQLQDPARQFNLTDVVCIPGNSSPAKALDLDKISTTDLVLWANAFVLLGDASATDFVTLATGVLARLVAIETAFNTHLHATGVGPTGPAVPLITPTSVLADIAATKVKGV